MPAGGWEWGALLGHITPHLERGTVICPRVGQGSLDRRLSISTGRDPQKGPGGRGQPHIPWSGRTRPGWGVPSSSGLSSPHIEDDAGGFPHLRCKAWGEPSSSQLCPLQRVDSHTRWPAWDLCPEALRETLAFCLPGLEWLQPRGTTSPVRWPVPQGWGLNESGSGAQSAEGSGPGKKYHC